MLSIAMLYVLQVFPTLISKAFPQSNILSASLLSNKSTFFSPFVLFHEALLQQNNKPCIHAYVQTN